MYTSHIFTIFQIFQRSVEPCPLRVTTQLIKYKPVPIYLELSFYSFRKISSIFDDNTWSKKFSKYKTFLKKHLVKSVNNKHALFELMSRQMYISIRLENGYIPEEKHG